MSSKIHYVYGLYDKDGVLIYIGRSVAPKQRRRIFERKYDISVKLKILFESVNFNEAAIREKELIKTVSPKYNNYISSSPTRLGMKNSKGHRRALSGANKGKVLSDDHKRKLWEERSRSPEDNGFYGKKHTPEAVEKIREATKLQFKDPVKRERHRLAVITVMRKL